MAKELAAMNVADVAVPESYALPFGTFERALDEDVETRTALEAAIATIDASTTAEDRRAALTDAREIITTRLVCPQDLESALSAAAAKLSPSVDIARLWDAVCGVWASKWTERAWKPWSVTTPVAPSDLR
jgi:alpha-glucan,water dikinase